MALVLLADRAGVVDVAGIECEACLRSLEELIEWGMVERLGPKVVRVLGMPSVLQ